MLYELVNILAPVFICTAIGFTWHKTGLEFNQQFVTRAVMNVGAPSLLISTLNNNRVSLGDFSEVVIVAVIVLVATGLIALPFARRAKGDSLAMIAPVVFPNTGNMGLPVCLFAFGTEGLALAMAFFLVSMLLHMTLAVPLFMNKSGKLVDSAKELVREPLIYALIVSIFMLLSDYRLPTWASNTVTLLAGFTIPMMLLTLGVSLASLKSSNWMKSLGFSTLRMGGGFVVALLVTNILGITGLAQKVALLQGMMPAAVFNYLLAAHYKRDPEITAGIVITSTLLAFILVPLLLSFLL